MELFNIKIDCARPLWCYGTSNLNYNSWILTQWISRHGLMLTFDLKHWISYFMRWPRACMASALVLALHKDHLNDNEFGLSPPLCIQLCKLLLRVHGLVPGPRWWIYTMLISFSWQSSRSSMTIEAAPGCNHRYTSCFCIFVVVVVIHFVWHFNVPSTFSINHLFDGSTLRIVEVFGCFSFFQ